MTEKSITFFTGLYSPEGVSNLAPILSPIKFEANVEKKFVSKLLTVGFLNPSSYLQSTNDCPKFDKKGFQ